MRVSQLLCVACCVVAVTASADVIEIDVTVKAVDAKARKITVARNTAKGERVKTLDVARKAGDISELAEGQVVSITYDPELGIVAKVTPKPGSDAAAEAPMPREPKSLKLFKFSGDQVATAEEADAMLLWLGATITGRDPGDGWVTGRLKPDLEITIWPKTHGKDRCYGVRFGNPDAGGPTQESYFEVCRNQAPEMSDEKQAPPIDPATVERLTPEQARRLTTSPVVSLPRLRDLTPEVARELATYREQSKTITYTVMVPFTEEKTSAYTVMVPHTLEKVRDDGSKYTVTESRPEQRTRTYTVTKCKPEERTRKFPVALQLDGLSSLEARTLAELAQHEGNLHLNGLKALSREQAQSLAAHKGGMLALDGLKSLDAKTAEVLAGREGVLTLNGLESLSHESAKALGCHKGELSLNGLKELADDLASAVVAHKGMVSLKGITKASDKAKEILAGTSVVLPPELLSTQPKEKE